MVDKLTNEQISLIKSVKADGEISKEDREALMKAGLTEEIIKGLAGDQTGEYDDFVTMYFKYTEEEEPTFLDKMANVGKKVLNFEINKFKLFFQLSPLGLFSSCVDYDHHEYNFWYEFTAESSNEEIIALLKEGNATLEQILTALTSAGLDNERIVDILLGIQSDVRIVNEQTKEMLDQIDSHLEKGNKLSEENNQLLSEILDALGALSELGTEGQKILNAILAKLTESVTEQKAMNAETRKFYEDVLAKLDTLSSEMKAGFGNVVDKIETLDENQLKFATAILAKLDAMDENQQKFAAAVLTVLEKLPKGLQDGLDNILKAVENNTLTDKEILAKLTDLFNKIGTLQPGQVTDLTVVVNAINALGGDLDAILAEIQKGNSQLDAIREAIEKNNQIAAKTNEAIGNLAAQNNKDHETIINLMKQLLAKAETDSATLDDIKAILKEIKTNTKGNWDTSLRIEDKLNLVAQTINVILETQQDLGEETKGILLQILAKITQPGLDNETKDILLKILAKIPDGCECETVDLSVIVEKLDELIKATEEGRKDPIHEGILDDLEDALG